MDIFGIPVIIEHELGSWIVRDEVVNMYGIGATEQDAIDDYEAVVWEYYDELQQGNLGDNLVQHLEYLHERLSGMTWSVIHET